MNRIFWFFIISLTWIGCKSAAIQQLVGVPEAVKSEAYSLIRDYDKNKTSLENEFISMLDAKTPSDVNAAISYLNVTLKSMHNSISSNYQNANFTATNLIKQNQKNVDSLSGMSKFEPFALLAEPANITAQLFETLNATGTQFSDIIAAMGNAMKEIDNSTEISMEKAAGTSIGKPTLTKSQIQTLIKDVVKFTNASKTVYEYLQVIESELDALHHYLSVIKDGIPSSANAQLGIDPFPQVNAANVDLEKMASAIIVLNNFLNVITYNYDKAIETMPTQQTEQMAKAITTVYGPICLAIIEFYRMEFDARSFNVNFLSVVTDLTNK